MARAEVEAVLVRWLFKRRRWQEGIGDVLPRFYCSRCLQQFGRKVINPLLTISTDPAPPRGLSGPDEREWKKMASRYRG